MATTLLDVDGLGCDRCVKVVRRVLAAVPAVRSVEASPGSPSVRVEYEGSTATMDAVLGVLRREGFTGRIRGAKR
ncbi:MAG: heavy-metal-associated domain-containing protein [Thermoanaerobaculia bacterium]